MRTLICVLAVCACKSESKEPSKPTKPVVTDDKPAAADPACLTKAKDLTQFLELFTLEVASFEINMGWKPVVVELTPSPVPDIGTDYLTITPSKVAIFDASESDWSGDNIGVGKPADAKLKETFDKQTDAKGSNPSPPDLLRIDVDADVPWSDVARIVTSAQKAGYKQAVFAFEPKFVYKEWGGLAAQTTDRAEVDAASKAVDDLLAKCKPLRSATYKPQPQNRQEAEALAQAMGDGLAACNCAIDHEELKKQMFKRDRWHQAHPRAGVTVTLAADGESIAQPKATPWSEAHKALLDKGGKAVALVAK